MSIRVEIDDGPEVSRKAPDDHEPTTLALVATQESIMDAHWGQLWWQRPAPTADPWSPPAALRSVGQPSDIEERIVEGRLRQAGVPIDELRERLTRLDMSVRGTPEELRKVDAQIMEDLAPARAAANRLELGD